LKRILGRHYRKLVTQALRGTKRDFLTRLDKTGAFFIKRCFNLDPGRFWRVAKGREFINLPKPPVQLLLFSDESDDTLQPLSTTSEDPSC
jgi:hypothetical protein